MNLDRRVIALALARMADSVGNSFLIVVLPLYIASGSVTGSFGLPEAVVTGIVLSMFGLLNSVTQPFVGRFSDRLGQRKVFVLAGLATLVVTNAAYAFVSSYAALVAIRAIQGVGVALTISATIALVNELASEESRGGNMGVFNAFRLVGFGAGPIGAGAVVHAGPYELPVAGGVTLTGFDAAFYLAALTALVSLALVTILVSDPETTAAAEEDLSIAVFSRDSNRVLDPVFTLGVASLFMAMGIALLATIETQVNHHLGQGPTMFGIEFAAFVAAQVLLQLPIGWASDNWGRRPFILAGLALLVPTTAVQGFVATPVAMMAARFAQGAAAAMVFAPSLALAGDLATGGNSGSKLSILTMAFGLGTALGPLATGVLVQYGYTLPFEFGAGLAVVGLLLVYTQVTETVVDADDAPMPSSGD